MDVRAGRRAGRRPARASRWPRPHRGRRARPRRSGCRIRAGGCAPPAGGPAGAGACGPAVAGRRCASSRPTPVPRSRRSRTSSLAQAASAPHSGSVGGRVVACSLSERYPHPGPCHAGGVPSRPACADARPSASAPPAGRARRRTAARAPWAWPARRAPGLGQLLGAEPAGERATHGTPALRADSTSQTASPTTRALRASTRSRATSIRSGPVCCCRPLIRRPAREKVRVADRSSRRSVCSRSTRARHGDGDAPLRSRSSSSAAPSSAVTWANRSPKCCPCRSRTSSPTARSAAAPATSVTRRSPPMPIARWMR